MSDTRPVHPDSTEPTRDIPAGARAASPPLPFSIGRYEARRLIASHGQGLLYEAFDPEQARTVAIKVVVSRGEGDDGPERCDREAAALALLHHPHIVRPLDRGATEIGGRGARYFVMEYLHGARDLVTFAREHTLKLHERIQLFIPLCEAIGAGHAQGILHRDIKPTNLLVDKQGNAKVIDFGLAAGRAVDPLDTLRGEERGSIIGTVCYMSPQHFEHDPDLIDERSDIYALGVVLYELITERLPYEVLGTSLREASDVICHQEPAPMRRAARRLRGDLEAVTDRALEKDPIRRYQSAEELAEELRRWLSAQPVRARGNGLPFRLAAAIRAAVFWYPGAALVPCWFLAMLAAALLARPALSDFTPLDRWFEWAGVAARTAMTAPGRGFRVTRAVVVDDETDVRALADRMDLPSVRPGDGSTYRALYGRMLARLAEARPAVVAIDIAFAVRDHPGDPELVAGIEALKAVGCEVVVGVWNWPPHADAVPPHDPDVMGRAAWGGITGEYGRAGPWRADLAVRQPGDDRAVPSLALAAVAAFLSPGSDPVVEISPESSRVRLMFSERADAARPVGERTLPTSFVRLDAGDPSKGIARGALVAHYLLEVPPDADFADAVYNADELFAMGPSQLSAQFHGRIVVLANSQGGADLVWHPDGRRLEGYKAPMVTMEMLAHDKAVRHATGAQYVVVIGVGSVLGLCVGVGAASRSARRWSLLLVGAAVIISVTLAVLVLAGIFMNPGSVIVGMVIAAECSAGVARVRRVRGVGLLHRPTSVGVRI